jgi:recombination associated protein RdgC
LNKAERKEAREQARSRADKESAAGLFRRMKQYPVFWDVSRNEVYLGATGATVADHFMMLFRETFDLSLVPASSGEMAARYAGLAGETRAFDDCRPAHFVNPPDGAEVETDSNRFMESAGKDFLGTEWLTWLWYTSHVESSEIMTGIGESVVVMFEKALQLECAFKLTGTTAINAEGPTRLPEAPVAMSNGKRPVKTGLQIAARGELFSLSIRGDVMNFGSVQLPPIEDATDARAVFEDRISKLRDLIDAVGGTYTLFLKRRLSSKWQQTLNAMRTWIAGGRSAASHVDEPVPVAG